MEYMTFTCKDCRFHSAGFCLKRYSSSANYETCDEYEYASKNDKEKVEDEAY